MGDDQGRRPQRSFAKELVFLHSYVERYEAEAYLFFLFLRLSFKMDEMAVLPRQSGSLIQQMLLCTPSTGKGFISGCPLS